MLRRLILLVVPLLLISAAPTALSAHPIVDPPPGWLDVTAWQQQPDGSLAPLPDAVVLLTGVFGAVVARMKAGPDGHAHLEAAPEVYNLTVRADGLNASATHACGATDWNTTPETSPWGANTAFTESTVEFTSGKGACRDYSFQSPPPPPHRPVRLTFDDGYLNLCATVDLVNGLGIHATFFLTGQAILANQDCVRRLVAAGNQLANHTYAHENLTRLSRQGIINTLQRTEDAAQAVAAVSTKPYCRPPYGAVNAAVRQAAADWGCSMVMWDRDTRDWAGLPAGTVANTATSVSCNGEIVLLHTQAFPRDQFAVPSVVKTLRERGCSFTNVNEP